MLKKLIGQAGILKLVESSANSPEQGVYLGMDRATRKAIVLSERELNQHVFMCGTTGTGKTTTIMCFVEYCMKAGLPLVLIDGKGDLDFIAAVKSLAVRYGREVQCFSLGNPDRSHHYNPLTVGGPTELKDRLMTLSEWTEPHYQYLSERFMQIALTIYQRSGIVLDLPKLVYGLSVENLIALAKSISAPYYILNYLEDINERGISGLTDRLAVLVESQIGHLFADEPGRTISLIDTIQKSGVAVFSLDSLAYPLYSQLLGRLVINDLKAVASRRRKEDRLAMLVFDEFNVFASRPVVDMINKTRSKRFGAMIATQSLADLDVVAPALKKQIVQNCNTVIIQRQNDPEDAEVLAAVIGTEDTWQMTHQHDTSQGATGMGSARLVKEFVVHPDGIKQLKTGEAIIVRKTPKFQIHQTKIIRRAAWPLF